MELRPSPVPQRVALPSPPASSLPAIPNPDLHEEIWLRRPPGFTKSFPVGTQWSLRRPVYGLRQAPREWHDTLRTTLAALGFTPSTADPSLFLRTDPTRPPFYILMCADDLVFATADTEALTLVKAELHKRHTCTGLGELRSYLGLQITRDRAQCTIILTQSHMMHQVLQLFRFRFSLPQPTPLLTGHSLSAPPSDESVEPSGPYPELVGCLMAHRFFHSFLPKAPLRCPALLAQCRAALQLLALPAPRTLRPAAARASRSAAPRVTPCCSPHVVPICPARRALLQPARRTLLHPTHRALLPCTSRPAAASASRPTAASASRSAALHSARPAALTATTTATAAARATAATRAGGAGPTIDHHCLSWPLSQQLQRLEETISPQVLSELFPQRCVTDSVEAAALGAGESAAALGASEPTAALGASESAAALGARASPATGPSSAEALHTFTLDSGASRCFFHHCTTLTPLAALVPLSLADPTGGPVVTRASTVLPCPVVPSGSLSRLHLPTFWTNLVSNAAIQDVWVDTFIPGGQRLAICTSLPSLPRSPAPPCLPCVERRQRAAPHSSKFPPTTSPLQTLHMDVWGPAPVGGTDQERYFLLVVDDCTRYTTVFPLQRKADVSGVLIPWICATRHQLRERFSRDFPVLRLHSDRGGEFSSDLLAEFCRDEGIHQTFTLPASPQKNGIAERRIGLIMEVARTSMIHAVAPHFLWSFAVQYAADQLNLWPRVSEPETSPTLRWTGKVGNASVFRVWGTLSLVRDAKASELSSRTLRCVFLGFPTDAPPWQFYHPRSRRVFSYQDVTFDKSVCFYRLHPHVSHPVPVAPHFLVPVSPPPPDRLPPPKGRAPSSVSQVDPPPLVEPLEISFDSSGPAEGGDPATDDMAATRRSPRLETPLETSGAEPGGAEIEIAGSGGAATGGARSCGAVIGGADSGGTAGSGGTGGTARGAGGAAGAGCTSGATGAGGARATRPRGTTRAGGAGLTSPGGTAGAGGAGGATSAGGAGAGGTGGGRSAGLGGARNRGSGAARAGGAVRVGGAIGAACSGGTASAGGAGARGTGGAGAAGRGGAHTRGARAAGAGGATGAGGAGGATGATGAAGTGGAGGTACASLTERRDPETRASTHLRARRVAHPRPPAVPGTHDMALRPSSVPQRVVLPEPPAYSLPHVPDPESDLARAASPTIIRLLATVVTDPDLEYTSAFALGTELVYFAARSRLDYVTSLVTESESVYPPSVGGKSALSSDVLEDRQFELECLAAALPRFASMLLCPEGDPDAPSIPTPRSYAEAIAGEYSSQWQTAMDAEMASWKSTGTYVDEVPPPRANIVDGMWIFIVKRLPSSPPAFKARYVARGFTQRDYDLHFLDFSTAFLQGSLHEEIWLCRPPSFTGSFPTSTQWSLRRPVYGLHQAPREWHDTLRTTLADLGFAPFSADPSLFLRTYTTLLSFYVLVYVDDLVFATADTEALALVLQRFAFQLSSPQPTPLSTGHSLSPPPSDESVEPSGPYPELVGCLIYEAEIYAGAMAAQELPADRLGGAASFSSSSIPRADVSSAICASAISSCAAFRCTRATRSFDHHRYRGGGGWARRKHIAAGSGARRGRFDPPWAAKKANEARWRSGGNPASRGEWQGGMEANGGGILGGGESAGMGGERRVGMRGEGSAGMGGSGGGGRRIGGGGAEGMSAARQRRLEKTREAREQRKESAEEEFQQWASGSAGPRADGDVLRCHSGPSAHPHLAHPHSTPLQFTPLHSTPLHSTPLHSTPLSPPLCLGSQVASQDPELMELFGDAMLDPQQMQEKMEERIRSKQAELLAEKLGSGATMQVAIKEIDPFDMYIWFELHKTPSEDDMNTLGSVIRAWYVVGKLGGYNSANLQLMEGDESSKYKHDVGTAAAALPAALVYPSTSCLSTCLHELVPPPSFHPAIPPHPQLMEGDES
ncbi:unnamed protein product [Closterium sp. NIES-54]